MADKCLVNPDRDCYGLIKAREIEKDLNDLRKQNSATHERIFERLGDIEKEESAQKVQYENVLEKLGNLSEDLNDLKSDSKEIVSKLPPLTQGVEKVEKLTKEVEEMKAKPAKRQEKIIETVISLVVAAVVGYVLAQIGL